MNPNLTANLRRETELQADIHQQKLAEVREKLSAAQPLLIEASELITKIDASYFTLNSAIADALYYCGEALHELSQNPQPDE